MALPGFYHVRAAQKDNRFGGRRLRLEALESRLLLSLSVAGHAVPDYVAYVAPNSLAPMSTAGPTGYTPAQIRASYGFDKITFNNGTVAGDGSGTTIAIVDAYDDPKIANDLQQFDLQFGLPDPVLTKVNENGGTSLPAANAGWISEIALDVEWAHAIAPKANILLVEAASDSMSDLLTAVDYARHATGVVAVSMSWGGGEFSGEASYDSYFTTPSGHTGVTFVTSSGDSGAPTSYPAASSDVLSVGGTTLNLSQGGYGSESGWSGSGGGISAYELQPSYQKGVVSQSTSYRTNPDVAYDSNPNTGFPVYDSYNNPVASPWSQFGGTSDAAPQWAAPGGHRRPGTGTGGQVGAGRRHADVAHALWPLRRRLPRRYQRLEHRATRVIPPGRGMIWSPAAARPTPTWSSPILSARPTRRPPSRISALLRRRPAALPAVLSALP